MFGIPADVAQLVEYLKYLPRDGARPADCTHVVRIESVVNSERRIEFAVKIKDQFAGLVDFLLGVF